MQSTLGLNVNVMPLTREDVAAPDLHVRLSDVDCVIGAHGAVGRRLPRELHASNVTASAALTAACRAAGSRYIHVSTGAVLGSRVIDDSIVLTPRTEYARSKASAERLVEYERSRGLIAVIARPTSVHGPGRPLTAQLVRFLQHFPVPMVAEGDAPFPFSWVGYVSSALVELALHTPVVSKPVVVAERRAPTAREFVAAWSEASGRDARVLHLRPAVARGLAASLDVLARVPVANRLPVGAVELLRYRGWKSEIEQLVSVAPAPLATVLRTCIADCNSRSSSRHR